MNKAPRVFIIDGARTPFLKAKNKASFSAADLSVYAARQIFIKQSIALQNLDEVVVGCAMPLPNEANIARVIALRLGCDVTIPAWTVQRNCASGLQSIDAAYQSIRMGRAELVLAGGCEAMSAAPLIISPGMINWLKSWRFHKSFWQKLKLLAFFKLESLKFISALELGLYDPICGLSMGQTAENLAAIFHITRQQMDEYALRSHHRLMSAQDQNYFDEIVPIYDENGVCHFFDEGVRRNTNLEKLAKLPAIFDKKFGHVTAGNSSQISDGAAFLLLASEQAVEKYHLTPLSEILDVAWVGVTPEQMGLGPVHAMTHLLNNNHLNISDIHSWQINEAFAAQVLACIKAWQDEEYCQKQLGLETAMGKIPINSLNVHGGAISIGHPIGASGARIVLRLAKVLQIEKKQKGIASICIGGGQGGAILLKNCSS